MGGAAVTVRLLPSAASGLTYVGGHGFRVGQVGNFVRIEIGLLDLYAVISQIGAAAAPQAHATEEPYGHRWMTIQLVGEAQPGEAFERGLSEYPTIGDPVSWWAFDEGSGKARPTSSGAWSPSRYSARSVCCLSGSEQVSDLR